MDFNSPDFFNTNDNDCSSRKLLVIILVEKMEGM